MRFPIVGILSAAASALGLYGMYWYHNLDKEAQAEVDGLAADHAKRVLGKSVELLTSQPLGRVNNLANGGFAA